MIKAILRWFFKVNGWQIDPQVPASALDKCVIIAAPHTYLPDMPLTYTALQLLGVDARITVADKYAFWPIKGPLQTMGAIWINRRTKTGRGSYIDTMTSLFDEYEKLCVVVAAEGTRSLRTEWRTGFYHIALQAGVPICLGYLDYDRKVAGIGLEVIPTGNMEEDMRKIMAFYVDIPTKHPEKFSVDRRYYP